MMGMVWPGEIPSRRHVRVESLSLSLRRRWLQQEMFVARFAAVSLLLLIVKNAGIRTFPNMSVCSMRFTNSSSMSELATGELHLLDDPCFVSGMNLIGDFFQRMFSKGKLFLSSPNREVNPVRLVSIPSKKSFRVGFDRRLMEQPRL